MKWVKFLSLPSLSLLLLSCALQSKPSSSIPDMDFNNGWLFHKGSADQAESPSFDDTDWRPVTLPHDWAIEGPFDARYNARTGGLPVHGTGWYRKHFPVPQEWAGKRLAIAFDGAMANAHVWVNGKLIGNRPYGYIGFEFDITEAVRFGEENVIAVRLTPEDLAMRWYPGAGLYRNVRLRVNEPLHIPNWGSFITTPEVSAERATVSILTTVRNDGDTAMQGELEVSIFGPDREVVASRSDAFDIEAGSQVEIRQDLVVDCPALWDLDQPSLYTAVSRVISGETAKDLYETEFGIRTIAFHPDDGFSINGRTVRFNGVCMHHDLGPLGAAVNYRATERQLEIMQSMGVNALRTSHNPPSPEVLQVCDRLGILVIVEAFDEWKIGKVPNGYNKYFDEWHERDLRDMIRRDRNHPSVILWSIGNEILEQGEPDGWKVAKRLNDICHDEDPSRLTTVGFNVFPAPIDNKLAFQGDVVCMNYWPHSYTKLKELFPDMIIYGSETSSQTSSRGVYHLPLSPDPEHETRQVSSYDIITGPPWAYAPDIEFSVQEANPFVLGEFIWTGFDYLGEPTPYGGRDNSTNGYWNDDWPSHASYFAPVDLCGLPKDRYYLYQSQWTDDPMVHLLPHWNWEGRGFETIPVFVYTKAEEVELFLNGKSLGRKRKGMDVTTFVADYHDFDKGPFDSPYRLSWDVAYEPGELKAVAYNGNQAVATKARVTAGPPAAIELLADRHSLRADGQDLAFVTVRIVDEAGNPCPEADNMVHFSVTGAGDLRAVGNGDSTDITPFQSDQKAAFSGLCLAIVATRDGSPGEIIINARSSGLESAALTLSAE